MAGFVNRAENEASTRISPEVIRAEVARYWIAFTSKSQERLEEFYAPDASVFGSNAIRAEPGRLTVVRRSREYFNPRAQLRHCLGQIDVQLFGNGTALASYTFQFEAHDVAGPMNVAKDEKIAHGRATQVFVSDPDGTLRIVHEHLSEVKPG
ncbi:MAG: DUF4440 domain-containing protein [Acidobacteriia bacterium]|nr:DUF4440 domain-containing protein [Terriglobia bacterium]